MDGFNLAEIARNFSDEGKAREFIEKIRWPKGPVCPHCNSNGAYKIKPRVGSKTRPGVYKCKKCRKQFTVMVNTIFEGSHIPLSKWLMAIHLFCSSKKGMAAHQLHRMLGLSYKSAWFMAHRIRHAVSRPILQKKLRGLVEADETYIGGRHVGKRGRGSENKTPVFSLVERNGEVRSQPIKNVTGQNLKGLIKENVHEESIIFTDEFRSYRGVNIPAASRGALRAQLQRKLRRPLL